MLWKRVLLHDSTTCCEWRHNLANPRSPQPPYMYFVCERPISMAVERWTNLSMSQQPPWTDTLIDLMTWITSENFVISTLLCELHTCFSQAFSEDDVTQQLQARNLKVGWSDGAMEHTSSGFCFRSSLYLAILDIEHIAHVHCHGEASCCRILLIARLLW